MGEILILKFEDGTRLLVGVQKVRTTRRLFAAISAKRYCLFNLDNSGEPIIRKASAHGLGHLLSPYDDETESDERESGVRQWQEDLWKEIIKSLRSPNPLEVRLDWRKELGYPAVSQYTAPTPDRLAWFKDFNRDKPYAQRVKPFNFLLEFYGKRPDEMARQGLLKSTDDVKRQPKPSAPYNRDPYKSLPRNPRSGYWRACRTRMAAHVRRNVARLPSASRDQIPPRRGDGSRTHGASACVC